MLYPDCLKFGRNGQLSAQGLQLWEIEAKLERGKKNKAGMPSCPAIQVRPGCLPVRLPGLVAESECGSEEGHHNPLFRSGGAGGG